MSFEFKYNYPQIARDSGFKLRQFRDGPVDWRLVGSLEVERILREQQFEHIDAILFYLSEAPLATMLESNILDSGIAKYFVLSQLAIQYLIFCRKFLDETVRTLRESLVDAEVENTNLKTANQEHSNEILQLHKKLSQIEAINDIVFPCHVCTKNFVSNDALNVHLSKKHLKNQMTESQAKDRGNDRTLINTIKLELEIKQLKERLNVAEKDIRETVESKKSSPRETVRKVSSSTQIHTATKDIATQSNLIESKETDSTEKEDLTDEKLGILTQIQEKISNLETWQETQSSGNQQAISEITEKLGEITKSLQSRSEQDAENLTRVAKEAILASIASKENLAGTRTADELQASLSKTVSDVLHLNSSKLNDILNRIEDICEKKLPLVEREVKDSGRIVAVDRVKIVSPVISIPSKKVEPVFTEGQLTASHSKATYSIERFSPIQSPNIIESTNDTESESNSTDMSLETLESEKDDREKEPTLPKQKTAAIPKKVTKTLDQEMSSYGINPSSKSLSTSDAAKITAHLAEKRSSLKKIYPRFYATRNKLRTLVDRLSSEKKSGVALPEIAKSKPKDTYPQHAGGSRDDPQMDKKAFEKHLQQILNSPIKKPQSYLPRRVKEPSKPVPLPRKRVMFSNEM